MAEQRTLNPQVLGSNPRGRTRSEQVFGNQNLTHDYNVTTNISFGGLGPGCARNLPVSATAAYFECVRCGLHPLVVTFGTLWW